MNDKLVYDIATKTLNTYCKQNGINFEEIINDNNELIRLMNSKYDGMLQGLCELIYSSKEALNKKTSGNNVISTLKRILNNKEATLKNHSFIKDGKQYFTDGYRAIVLNNVIDSFPETKNPMNIQQLIDNAEKTCNIKLNLNTTIAELKIHISNLKAQGIKKTDSGFYYQISNTEIYVNPQYLIDMLEILTDSNGELNVYWTGNAKSVIYFESEKGYGILLPIFRKK